MLKSEEVIGWFDFIWEVKCEIASRRWEAFDQSSEINNLSARSWLARNFDHSHVQSDKFITEIHDKTIFRVIYQCKLSSGEQQPA